MIVHLKLKHATLYNTKLENGTLLDVTSYWLHLMKFVLLP